MPTKIAGNNLLWWIIPGALAGMPLPFVHPERRLGGGPLATYDDELPILYTAGIRAVVSLLNIPSDAIVFESAGFTFKCQPVPDGGAPAMEQAEEFIQFIEHHLALQNPVAVHSEAGLGRTGTMLATHLISQRDYAESAIRKIRTVERAAIETSRQIRFLVQFAAEMRLRRDNNRKCGQVECSHE